VRATRVLAALAAAGAIAVVVGVAGAAETADARAGEKLPWAAAGLTERQAAAHLLDRFAFGPRPGDVDRVVAIGLEAWLESQLGGAIDDSRYLEKVQPLDAWRMSPAEIARVFPPASVLRREAMRAGMVDRSMDPDDPAPPQDRDEMAKQRKAILRLYSERGLRLQGELLAQLKAHKLLQAVHSENQLEAVLDDFWFNHFNVSLTDNQARSHLVSFERDVIAPGVLGKFGDLLAEVAAHPAMLLYLDNAQSTASPGTTTTLDRRLSAAGMDGMRRGGAGGPNARPQAGNRPRGLNENYARELLELHTLGVDGGYTQDDVIAVARAFTGWTVVRPDSLGGPAGQRMERAGGAGRFGFVERESGFRFRPDAHDAEAKTVLGKKLAAGRGLEDGLDVLALLARHPSTARHLATKIAARFVADEPPPELVDRLARRFLASDGDLREVMRTLAYAPEFWSVEARGSKIKAPFELAVSAVRALGADVAVPPPTPGPIPLDRRRGYGPTSLLGWIERMGQPLYAYQAPTGFPDRAEAWVSTGSLLTRMNFGLNLAASRIVGVDLDLAALNGNREPESPEHALATYAALVLPERDLDATVKRLEPLLRDPELGGRVERAAADATEPARAPEQSSEPLDSAAEASSGAAGTAGTLDQVVGLILGSPEFQRR
jgi:uncharacterized protein (DUF1800 family)